MNRILLGAAAALAVVIATLVLLRPASSVGPGATTAATPSEPSKASQLPTVSLPPGRQLSPTAVIDLVGKAKHAIPITADGEDIWIGVDGGLIRVDGRTNATREIAVPHMLTANGHVAAGDGELWIADYKANVVERIDPATGAVLLDASAPGPVELFFLGDQLWVGSHVDGSVHLVDRRTGALGPKVGQAYAPTVGLGEFWTGEFDGARGDHLSSDTITRLDPSSGASTMISVPAGSGCGVSGSFPDNVWAGCPAPIGEPCSSIRPAVRIDPATNQIVASTQLGGGGMVASYCGGVAVVVDGVPWFFVGRDDGGKTGLSLVAVDSTTGQLKTTFDLGLLGWNNQVGTSTALWIPDEEGHRVVRYELAVFRN